MEYDRTLLVVDDDTHTRRALVRALDGLCTIVEADSAEEALQFLHKSRVDVILSDHDMPGMCGLDLLRTVRLRWPNTHRLIVTAARDFDVAVRAINLGEVDRFLTKPWQDEDMVCSVREALEKVALDEEERAIRARAREGVSMKRSLEANHPGITRVQRDASGAIVLEDEP